MSVWHLHRERGSLSRRTILVPAAGVALALSSTEGFAQRRELLNVSYDPTRELYREFNEAFARHWREAAGQEVVIQQSHAGSGSQARAVIDGLDAEVVTLALAYDVDAIRLNSRRIQPNWRQRRTTARRTRRRSFFSCARASRKRFGIGRIS